MFQGLFHLTSTVYILILLVLVILLKYVINTYQRNPKLVQLADTISGPPEIPILGSFLDFFNGEDLLKKLVNYTEKYGHMYKLWFGKHLVICLSRPEDIDAVFMSSKMLDKPDIFSDSFHDYWGDGIFTSPLDIWKNNRKKLLPPFMSNRFEQYAVHINNTVNNSIKIVEKHVDGREFNINNYTPIISFNIITKLMFNAEFSEDDKAAAEFHLSIMKAVQTAFDRMFLPWFHLRILSNIWYMKKSKEILQGTRKLTQKILNDKMSQIKNEIMLHNNNKDSTNIPPKLFLTHAFELLNDGYEEKVVHDEIMNVIGGGTATTSTMLSFFFLIIAIYQDIQMKLYDELYEVFGDSERDADQDDIRRLSYLDQVLKETLRRFPLIPFVLRGVQEDSKIRDRIFPAGTAIMISIAAAHFDPEYYPNPWEFNPQNFSPEAVESRPKHAFIPFSAGARNCIGQNLAMVEMKLIVTAFLRKFSFHTTMTINDIKLNKAFTTDCVNGYNVSIKYRIKKPSYTR